MAVLPDEQRKSGHRRRRLSNNRNRCILQQETATLDAGLQVTDPVSG